jgi:hypothetical protein
LFPVFALFFLFNKSCHKVAMFKVIVRDLVGGDSPVNMQPLSVLNRVRFGENPYSQLNESEVNLPRVRTFLGSHCRLICAPPDNWMSSTALKEIVENNRYPS